MPDSLGPISAFPTFWPRLQYKSHAIRMVNTGHLLSPVLRPLSVGHACGAVRIAFSHWINLRHKTVLSTGPAHNNCNASRQSGRHRNPCPRDPATDPMEHPIPVHLLKAQPCRLRRISNFRSQISNSLGLPRITSGNTARNSRVLFFFRMRGNDSAGRIAACSGLCDLSY